MDITKEMQSDFLRLLDSVKDYKKGASERPNFDAVIEYQFIFNTVLNPWLPLAGNIVVPKGIENSNLRIKRVTGAGRHITSGGSVQLARRWAMYLQANGANNYVRNQASIPAGINYWLNCDLLSVMHTDLAIQYDASNNVQILCNPYANCTDVAAGVGDTLIITMGFNIEY